MTQNDDYLALAREFAGPRVRLGTPVALPYADLEFPAAVCCGLLEFLPDEELDRALAELHRVVQDRVFLVIQTQPDPEERWPAAAPRDRAWWTARLRRAGFTNLPAEQRNACREFLHNDTGLLLCALRKLPPATPAAQAARIAAEVTPDLAAFVGQLAQFFQADDLLQLDFADGASVTLTHHEVATATAATQAVKTSSRYPRLPLADESADTAFTLGSLNVVDDVALPGWLAELRRVTAGNLWVALEAVPGRDRAWWENRFIEAGFRKHPLNQCVVGFEDLEHEAGGIILLLQKIPHAALVRYPLAQLKAERDLHMDMLREAGIRSDAHLARYVLAREFLKPGMVVLDAACGLGYGSAALASGTGAARVIGVDASVWAVDYARAHYGPLSPVLEFHASDATRIAFLPDRSVDAVVSFETMEHLPNPDRLLREFARVLKPGGLFIASVPNLWINEHGHNPVPYHLHIYDHEQLRDQVARYFECRALFRENAGGGWKRPQPRTLRAIPDLQPTAADEQDAEWWIVVAEKVAA